MVKINSTSGLADVYSGLTPKTTGNLISWESTLWYVWWRSLENCDLESVQLVCVTD